ncbi:zinc-ribbon domain-containing protein [Peribacillus kribbensis]|uniref:zinc-ribbon domain-containing protein n=1 Tax=Peribacillus kribbensis TaxID=356658 RepID=UPI00040BBC71|nr:zinc-ribbon domain-containing protein [Peribacillus kribbensis]
MKKNFYEWCIENDKENLLAEWDYEKNVEVGPKNISYGVTRKVWWKCPVCHRSYQAIINDRRSGRDCPYDPCRKMKHSDNIKKALVKRRGSLASRFPDLAKEWHPVKNGTFTPDEISPASDIKVWWLGSCSHQWQATPSNRVRMKSGCPICQNKIILIGFNDLASTHRELCREWDVEKNGDLLPTQLVAGTHKRVWWLCQKGHSYKASVSNRSKKNGTGCPHCDIERKSSFNEKVLFYYLKQVFQDAEENYRPHFLRKKEVDIYIPSLSLAIEYDGEFYHKNALKDIQKNDLCRENGIDVIRIREPKCPKLPEHVTSFARKTLHERELKECIDFIILYINQTFKMNAAADVDLDRDRSVIMEAYYRSEKQKSLAFMRPDIAEEWHPTKNGNLTTEHIPYSSNKDAWWLGTCGHEWTAKVNNRIHGNGCPVCYEEKGHKIVHRRSLQVGVNDLATENPILSKQWHPVKNGNLHPSDVLSGSKKTVWWLGECGHDWEAVIGSRNKGGHGCPYCSNKYVWAGFNDLETLHPQLAKEWHPSKNGDLKPSGVVDKSNKKVWWLGSCGHEWEARVNSRNRGTGCPYCDNRLVLQGFNDLATTNPKAAKEWHPTKNGDLQPTEVTSGSDKKVWWLGNCGHEWEAKIYSKKRCSMCSKK